MVAEGAKPLGGGYSVVSQEVGRAERLGGVGGQLMQVSVALNPGVSGGPPFSEPAGQIENIDLATWENVVKINQTGVFATMQAAARVMKPRRSGRIIVTCSISGLRTGVISGYTYSATKAAVVHLVHLAAVELAAYNIMVNGIAPGPFLTNIAGGRLHREPERVAFMANSVPLKRMADPSELKGLALLLALGVGVGLGAVLD